MQVRIKSRKLLAFVAFIALVVPLTVGFVTSAGAQEATPQPTISSDKADYPPGGTVVLTGSNWQPGEYVHINVNDEAGKSWSRDVDATADENGQIRDEFQLPDWFVAQYEVTATGAQSGTATTSFTDAALKLQGKSNPQCTSGGQCDSGYEGGPLRGWKELDEIPMRLKFASAGSYTVNVEFDHTTTSGVRTPGVQNLREWTAGSGVTLTETPELYDIDGAIWTYRVKVNVASTGAVVNFKAKLAAGSHNYPGSSLDVRADNAGGVVQISKPGVGPGSPDLAVDKTGPTTATQGETVTYTLDYQNKSTAGTGADGAQLTDVLPSGVAYVAGSCTGTCQVAGNEVIWDLGDLPAGASGSRSLQVRIPQNASFGTQYTDLAQILSEENDATPADNQDTLTTTVQFNRGPSAVDDSLTTDEDTAGKVNVLANDTDPDGDALSVTGQTQPQHGAVTRSDGTFTYTPNADYNGPDSFTYTISDGKGGTATGTVDVTVTPVNDPPVNGVPGAQSVDEDTPLVFSGGNSNPISTSDLDAGTNDVRVDLQVTHGWLTLGGTGGLTFSAGTGTNNTTMTFTGAISDINVALDGLRYVPTPDYNGPSQLTITTNDLGNTGTGGAQSDTDTVDITVNPINDPPQIRGVSNDGPIDEGGTATITVDANDPDGPLTYEFDCDNDGAFEKGPQSGNSAACGFADNGTYKVNVRTSDGENDPVTDSTEVEVRNVAPSIVLSGPSTANEGDTKEYTFEITDPGTADTHTIDRDCGTNGQEVEGSYGYDSNTRTGSFECRFPNGPAVTNVTAAATDKDGAKDIDNQRVEVTVANVAPVVKLDGPNTANEGDTKEYTFEITDPGADDQSPQADCGDGTLINDSFQYNPNMKTGSFECRFPHVTPEENLVTRVSVTTNDGHAAGSDFIDVSVLNVVPTAVNDSLRTTELKKVKANLLDNDENPGQNLDRTSMTLLSVEISPNAAKADAVSASSGTTSLLTGGGGVEIDELLDGNVTYTPNRGFVDIDAFRYEVCDDDGDCSRANVDVEVGPVDCTADGVILGTERDDLLRGTPGDDVICALGGNDRIYAGAGDDILVGGAGWDRMWAEAGNDVMRGGSKTDSMDAGLGDDYLSGDGGRDIMMGRGGTDYLEMKEGSPGDAGNGGAGTDTCSRDPGDKAVSCERR